LRSLSLTDFRSIRGTVSVPLDASVVLIHGHNGIGKTSLLSAIELALTGGIDSLSRSDSKYLSYLVHKEAGEAKVAVTIERGHGQESRELTIRDGQVTGNPLLTQADSSFFSERCYLAQATMTRLLELYQGKESTDGDSALTKFVKDLLGLDHLDALVEGLHDAGHVARLKNALPAYRSALDQLPVLELRLQKLSADRTKLNDEIAILHTRLEHSLGTLGIKYFERMPAADIQLVAKDDENTKGLQRIALLRRNLIAAREQWRGIKSALSGTVIVEAERESSHVSEQLDSWRKSDGVQIERAFQSIAALFSDLSDPATVGPQRAIHDALQVVTKELRRCNELLKKDTEATAQIAALDEQVLRAQSRLTVLDQQIAGHLSDADKLTQALTALLPLVGDQICPVCGRDYNEVSTDSLHSHLSSKISSLVESAGRLQAFVRERSDAIRLQGDASRRREGLAANQLDPQVRTTLSLRAADLKEREQILSSLVPAATTGEQLLTAVNSTSRTLSDLRSKNEQAVGFRARLREFEEALELPPIPQSEETEAALDRFESLILKRDKEHSTAQEARSQILADVQERSKQSTRQNEFDMSIEATRAQFNALTAELQAFDGTVKQARELAKIARNVRSDIVRKVFDNSLNALWRDLFIRLAPSESFVPAFTLPERESGVVEAVLETHYRSGGKGGNPRAMLSAGNLNTAALTLFLALHLSVAKKFPCLIIDDPFQSMDEVHIAQLAALMRTLSRQHGRQIIIAVHEKPLFEYLSLELFPAFPEDRLITIELGTSADGHTLSDPRVISFAPDKAISAA